MRFLGSIESTNPFSLAINPNGGDPIALVLCPMYTEKSGFVVAPAAMHVLHIKSVRSYAQIIDAIASLFSVLVIDFSFRPMTVNIQPSETMRPVFRVLDANHSIPSIGDISSHITNLNLSRWPNEPYKYPGIRVVMQQFLQTLLGKCRIALAHLSFSYNDGLGSGAWGLPALSAAPSYHGAPCPE